MANDADVTVEDSWRRHCARDLAQIERRKPDENGRASMSPGGFQISSRWTINCRLPARAPRDMFNFSFMGVRARQQAHL